MAQVVQLAVFQELFCWWSLGRGRHRLPSDDVLWQLLQDVVTRFLLRLEGTVTSTRIFFVCFWFPSLLSVSIDSQEDLLAANTVHCSSTNEPSLTERILRMCPFPQAKRTASTWWTDGRNRRPSAGSPAAVESCKSPAAN